MEQTKQELTRLTVVLLDGKDVQHRRKKEPQLRPLTVVRPPSGARAAGKGDRGARRSRVLLPFLAIAPGTGGGGNRKEEQGEGLGPATC
jgi:hypothetical protein